MEELNSREIRKKKKRVPLMGKTLILFFVVALIDALLAYAHIGVLYQYVLK